VSQDQTTGIPSIPTEAEIAAKIRALQQKMGIPTDQEVDPLQNIPGTGEELWPGGPGIQTNDIRIV